MSRPKLWGPDLQRSEETNDLEQGDLMVDLIDGSIRLAVYEGGVWVPDAFARNTSIWKLATKAAPTTHGDTPTADPDLRFAAAANLRYAFRARLYFDMSAGFEWGIYGPAGGDWRWRRSWLTYADTSYQGVALEQATSSVAISIPTGSGGVIEIDGIVNMGATGGTMVVGWAASAGGSATVRKGSHLEYKRI